MSRTEPTLCLIGEVAQRTGLSVSAIRYYSDEGLVRPTDVTAGGHRLYDVDAIARLEFIRTLRDLEAGLEQVRRLLTGATSLRELLAEHLEVVEKRATDLQTKRAVLRALVREESTTERADLLRRLVTMSDADRRRLIDDFWNDVAAGLPVEVRERIRGTRPKLPADPTPEQLDAWVTLAELLGEERFRSATRAYLHDTYATGPGAEISAPRVQEFIDSAGADLSPILIAAHRSGLAPEDPHVVGLAARLVEESADAVGVAADDGLRRRMAAGYRTLDSLLLEALQDADYTATQGRYLELVAIINDEPHHDSALSDAARRDPADGSGLDLRAFGQWLAAALLATSSTGRGTAGEPGGEHGGASAFSSPA
ncbi:helix-turn-helix domain-containing protein [Actinocorallia populi]|uniref:helix-turn-helix domain-containing protein n=1 Tax=Actinocorallia populi TaxID=2079200 RepID=UPI000D095C44|nr:MerR family transcriptional regulator [Actinocorallia populi]